MIKNSDISDGEFWPDTFGTPNSITGFVPVIHGCNKVCTYCIVPLRRGREISRQNRFDVSYDRVKGIPLVKNAINKYLWSHVRSSFLRIEYDEAALAVYLPVAQFRKGRPY